MAVVKVLGDVRIDSIWSINVPAWLDDDDESREIVTSGMLDWAMLEAIGCSIGVLRSHRIIAES